jgi:membrane fusion protein (multidrug efflux system)
VIVAAAALAIAGIGYGGIVTFHSFTHETTDDAFVDVHIVSVAPKVAGHVAVVRVDDNQLVKKGDVLIEIDPRDFQVALAQVKANLARDKATQIQAELNEKRALVLFGRKVISTQERDTNVATAESSRASVQADEECATASRPKRKTCRMHGDRSAPRIGNSAQFQARPPACRSYDAARGRHRSRGAIRSGLVAAWCTDRFSHFAHDSGRGKGWSSRFRAPDSSEAN